MIQIILFIAMGMAILILLFFIIKSVMAPKKIESIQKMIKQGKNASAIKIAKSMITKDPRDFKAHYYLGKAYLADGKPELAFMEYKLVNQNAIFDADLPERDFRTTMAQLYYKFNQMDEALKEYLLLTKLNPTNPENHYNAGLIFEEKNKSEQAMLQYQAAIKASSRHFKAHAALGLLFFRAKQFQEAKKEIDMAISLSPETYSNYYYLGKILKENKDYPAAVQAFEKAVRDPDFKQKSLIEKGNCYMLVSAVDKAMNEYDRAIKASTDDASQETLYARYFMALCYEKMRKIDLAISQWEKIYSINKSFRDVGAKLAEYKDLQTNDHMKEYLTCNSENFLEICKKTSLAGFNLAVRDIHPAKYGANCYAVENQSDNWMNMRQMITLIVYNRDAEVIEEPFLRQLLEEVKQKGFAKCIICTSSTFSRSALSFAENRPFELVPKEKLEQILAKITL